MSGITSLVTNSTRRACYWERFSELLARVRSVTSVQHVTNDSLLANLCATESYKSFPLPGSLTFPERLSQPMPKKSLPPLHYFIPTPQAVASDIFHNLNQSETRLASVQAQLKLDDYLHQMENQLIRDARPLRVAVDQIEFLVHDFDDKTRARFRDIFPSGIPTESESDFSAVVISHSTKHDMSTWSPEMEQERDQLTEEFVSTAKEIVDGLRKNGVWADFVDPASGRPYFSPYTNATLFETDDRMRQFGFRIQDLGCCKCLEHTVWGSKVFVGVLFTTTSSRHPVLKGILQNQVC